MGNLELELFLAEEFENLASQDTNSGNYNSGKQNSGHYNSGNYNSGNSNSGDSNSGDCNSGYSNSGDYNSGYCNSGYYNSGDSNSGDCNSGNFNSGYCNSGYCNSGDYNSGLFNTNEPPVRLFNKETNIFRENLPDLSFINSKWKPHLVWIWESLMTEQEKIDNPTYVTCGGYLKKSEASYKKSWAHVWNVITEEQRDIIKNLPNFDANIFEEITGIRV